VKPAEENAADDADVICSLADEPLTHSQEKLLDIAFETASAIPVYPHIKDKSLAQQKVVEACLELNQPRRALRYLKQIGNWRRGAAYADLAIYCARRGSEEELDDYLTRAEKIAKNTEDWRRDRIRVKAAKVHALLGRQKKMKELAKDVVPSETGKVTQVQALTCDADEFDERMKDLDKLLATKNFDVVKNGLKSCTHYFDAFYENEERRDLVEDKMRASWKTVPLFLRIELLMELAEIALSHDDQEKALDLVDDAQETMESVEWPMRYRIPMMAQLAELRFRSGHEKKAQADADAAMVLFDEQVENIVNIYRAETLVPLAEAYNSMGNAGAALVVYGRAIEEGVANPNSRTRAKDLSATCCSMAVHNVEPNEKLWARIRQISEGLGQPW
jgi:hypothetical protein